MSPFLKQSRLIVNSKVNDISRLFPYIEVLYLHLSPVSPGMIKSCLIYIGCWTWQGNSGNIMAATGSWKGKFSLLQSSLQAQNNLPPCCKVSSRSTTTSKVTKGPFCPQNSKALSAGGRSSNYPCSSCSSCKNICWFSFKTRHINLPF